MFRKYCQEIKQPNNCRSTAAVNNKRLHCQ